MSKRKMPVNFCWHCSRKFHGNHYAVLQLNGNDRLLHKQCKEDILEEPGNFGYEVKSESK